MQPRRVMLGGEDVSMIFQPLMICGGYSVIKELQDRFHHFMETGDDSRIPADLQRVAFSTVRTCSRNRTKRLTLTIDSRPYGTGGLLNTMLLLLSMKSQRHQQPELLQCRLVQLGRYIAHL